jgi:hypothetical protein
VTVDRRSGTTGDLTYAVTSLKLPTLKPASAPRKYVVGGDGLLRSFGMTPLAFVDGYSLLLAQRPGSYDKKKDARQPDSQAILDLLSGKVISNGPIDDLYGWARTTRLRKEHPNRTAFVELADTTGGQSGIEFVGPTGRLSPLPLAVPFRIYDRFTLKDQEGPSPDVVTFAIQVDPVNPDAVARKKADPASLDVYEVLVSHPDVARLRARVAVGAQPVVWSVAGTRLAVLRRFKSFARGGDRIDLYDLAN